MLARPGPDDYPEFFRPYIEKVPDGDVFDLLERQSEDVPAFFRGLAPDKVDYRYAPDKWSLREILGHLTDTERIMAYRALRFARNDPADLPGFDEKPYVKYGDFSGRSMDSLIEEFQALRRSDIIMLRSFSPEALSRSGLADGRRIVVRFFPFLMAGHVLHHLQVIRERYF